MPAIPSAPACMHSAAFSQFTPPKAYTFLRSWQALASAASPVAGPLPGESKTGPKVTRSASDAFTSSSVWHERADEQTGKCLARGAGGEMNAIGAGDLRHIGARIHQDLRVCVGGYFIRSHLENRESKFENLAGAQIFLADLNEIDA